MPKHLLGRKRGISPAGRVSLSAGRLPGHVIPRVGSILAQIPSVTGASPSSEDRDPTQGGAAFERFSPPKDQTEADPHDSADSKIIPFPLKDTQSLPATIPQALYQLMRSLKEQNVLVWKWLGVGAYNKVARPRKGIILDERVG